MDKIHKLEKTTRKILHKVHIGRIKNKKGIQRVENYLSTETLGLKRNYFENKLCADLGCGTHGGGGKNLLNMKAKYVHLLDLNSHIKKYVKKNLSSYDGKFQVDIGSIEKLPYKDNYFDFIVCSGVIHHMKNDRKAFFEIKRVLKKNGKCLLVIHGSGGIFTRIVMEVLRDEYRKNKLSKKVFDNIMEGKFQDYRKFLSKYYSKNQLKVLDSLINVLKDNDLRLTIKDRILCPKYKLYDEKEIKKFLNKIGFKNIKRVSIKPKFSNIRDMVSPLYLNYSHELARFLYGNGMLRLLATKE